MGTDNDDSWLPRSRVGAVVVALLNRDEDAAEKAAEQPRDDNESPVLAAAIRLAVRSLFDEDTPADDIATYVSTMARDVELNQDIAEALIRAQLGAEHVLDAFPPQEVTDTTWSMLGYLCEQQLGREGSLELMAQAEDEAL
jgi:hypothetical protein